MIYDVLLVHKSCVSSSLVPTCFELSSFNFKKAFQVQVSYSVQLAHKFSHQKIGYSPTCNNRNVHKDIILHKNISFNGFQNQCITHLSLPQFGHTLVVDDTWTTLWGSLSSDSIKYIIITMTSEAAAGQQQLLCHTCQLDMTYTLIISHLNVMYRQISYLAFGWKDIIYTHAV